MGRLLIQEKLLNAIQIHKVDTGLYGKQNLKVVFNIPIS